jgi:hypothetical protein
LAIAMTIAPAIIDDRYYPENRYYDDEEDHYPDRYHHRRPPPSGIGATINGMRTRGPRIPLVPGKPIPLAAYEAPCCFRQRALRGLILSYRA